MIRKAAVSGAFYPDNPDQLKTMVSSFLDAAPDLKFKSLKGLIVPHAGYIFSGPTAGHGYKQLQSLNQAIRYNVFLLGPAHYIYTTASVGEFDAFETPLGTVKVNKRICEQVLKSPDLDFYPQSHVPEHCLEVQLPFLQSTLKTFEIIPILIGSAPGERIFRVLQPFFSEPDSLFIFSSDLSHYKPYQAAKEIDQASIKIIEQIDLHRDTEVDACGSTPIEIAMRLAEKNNYSLKLLDYRNSGDTAGEKDAVVGYSSFALIPKKETK